MVSPRAYIYIIAYAINLHCENQILGHDGKWQELSLKLPFWAGDPFTDLLLLAIWQLLFMLLFYGLKGFLALEHGVLKQPQVELQCSFQDPACSPSPPSVTGIKPDETRPYSPRTHLIRESLEVNLREPFTWGREYDHSHIGRNRGRRSPSPLSVYKNLLP